MPEVSILMRSKNDIAYIRQTLEMVSQQTYKDFELLNVDSASTDGTFDIIKQFNPLARQIPAATYNPGRVLNEMAEQSSGSILVFLNSDATPTGKHWLESLIEPLLEQNRLAGTFGRQIAREDAHLWVQRDYLVTFGERSAPAKIASYTLGNDSWFQLFSLANAAIRRVIFEQRPLSTKVQYSEDIEWAHWTRKAGYTIQYVPSAVVRHSHNYTYQQTWKRFFEEGRADAHIFGVPEQGQGMLRYALLPYISSLLRDLLFSIGQRRPLAVLASFKIRWAQKFGRFAGLHAGLNEIKS